MSRSTKQIGDRGETIAAAYLEERGYVVMARNYRFERAEVDLVCFQPAEDYTQGGELVFVEVKARSGLGFGRPEEAVTDEKQRNLIRAARAYLYEHNLEGSPARFDVVSVLFEKGQEPTVEHIENAFWIL